MKTLKKSYQKLVLLSLSIALGACSLTNQKNGTKGGAAFDTYLASFPALLVNGNSFDVNFLFDQPETYGIDLDLYDLDFISLKEYQKSNTLLEDKLESLDTFDYEALNKDQKISYDLLENAAKEIDIDEIDQYYLANNNFNINSGIQASLPMALWNYEFKNQKSLNSFIAVLKQLPSYMKECVALEKTRQKKGYGMSKSYLDKVKEDIHTINTNEQTYILDATFQKIDAADFVAADKKQLYKDEIGKAFYEKYLPAFLSVEEDLKSVKVLKKGDGELRSYRGGKNYYEHMVSNATGSEDIKDYLSFLDEKEADFTKLYIEEMQAYGRDNNLFKSSGELDEEALLAKFEEAKYSNLNSAIELIEYFEGKVNEGTLFPKIKKLDYQMNMVPTAMKETISAAAAYYVSAFDDTSGKGEQMILNGDFKQDDFTTIAHESFPGHMYQNNYFKTVDHSIIRDLMGDNAYSEGWATYIESSACDYSKDARLCKINKLNSTLSYISVLKLDKKIHYDGLTRKEAYAYLENHFGIEDKKGLKSQYEQLLQLPAVFANYYGGFLYLNDLKNESEKAWGKSYSDYRFHKTLLDLGPLPMEVLRKYMEQTFE